MSALNNWGVGQSYFSVVLVFVLERCLSFRCGMFVKSFFIFCLNREIHLNSNVFVYYSFKKSHQGEVSTRLAAVRYVLC